MLSTVQSLFLVSGQIFLKFAMARMHKPRFAWQFIKEDIFWNWPLSASGISMVAGSLIWFYILKHFDFSAAYPMISISYIFGMLASIYVFHEAIPISRWIGVFLIISGVVLVAK